MKYIEENISPFFKQFNETVLVRAIQASIKWLKDGG